MCGSLGILGDVARRQGAYTRAAALYDEALPLAQEVGHLWGIATISAKLGALASEQGRHEPATRLLETSLRQMQELGDREGSAWVLGLLGRAARAHGASQQARRRFEESLALFVELRETWGIAESLEGLALTTWEDSQPLTAVRLLGAAETLREKSGIRRLSREAATHNSTVAMLRAGLGDAAFAPAWAEGRAEPLEQAILEARQSAPLEQSFSAKPSL
jgi:tetratricopeptide (TPR) repeat protein